MSTPREPVGRGREKPKQVRGDQLVAKVLKVTLEELARVGYGLLSLEHIAERAEVNKVTLYRRWSTKRDLARDALSSAVAGAAESWSAETGTFRSDLIAALSLVRDLADSPTTRAIMRLVAAGSPDDELVQIAAASKCTQDDRMKDIYRRAVARGELPPGHDLDLVHTLLVGVVIHTYLFDHARCTDAQLEYAVDLVVAGMRALPRPSRPGRGSGDPARNVARVDQPGVKRSRQRRSATAIQIRRAGSTDAASSASQEVAARRRART